MLEKVCGHAACLVDRKALVIADLHIGLEQELSRKGVRLPSLTHEMLGETLKLLDETKAEELILLGDVKHHIASTSAQEAREIPLFLKLVSEKAKVTVVLGNHDAGIKPLLGDAKVVPARGFQYNGTLLFHGNARPLQSDIDACSEMVASHWHPVFAFERKRARMVEKVWVDAHAFGKPLLILPSFNRLLGGVPLDEVECSWLDLGKARITLLDGVCIGGFKGK
jgi:hypothetical protein